MRRFWRKAIRKERNNGSIDRILLPRGRTTSAARTAAFPSATPKKVAEMLADLTGGELYKIEQAEPYSDDYKTCVAQAREDWQKNARPAVLDPPDDLDAYDEIYLGYPNYCSTMPMAVYTFLEHYDFTGKTIHPFCTHEGSGLSDTENDIRKAAHGAAVTKGLAIHGSHVDEAKSALAQWVEEFAK